jgi:nitrite reductase/ring-hydroxylating ferredoxin subunit/uncharacterized membrane protein
MQLRYQIDRLHLAEGLDPAAEKLANLAEAVLPERRSTRDLLHGTWLGHPLHPALTDVPIGFWTSAFLLDVLGGERAAKSAEQMVAAGLLSAVPTALAGLADWQSLGQSKEPKRVGVVHAMVNGLGMLLYAMSWVARRRGQRRPGVLLGSAGGAVVTFGGYLGGHLAYRQAVGVDHQATEPKAGGWTDIGRLDELPENRLQHAHAGSAHLVVYRQGDHVAALAAHCAHLAGPLHEGELVEADGQACVVCPWHGSTFAVKDGSVVHGPATAPQPSYEVRVRDGRVEVKARPLPKSSNGQISVAELAEG